MAPDPNQNFKGKSSIEDGSVNELSTFQNLNGATNSSSEEENEIENNGYEPLPQEADGFEEGEIDYSSLSGIMNALNTYGPQYVDFSEENNETQVHEAIPNLNNEALPNFASELNASHIAAEQFVIDKEKEEEIKNVMSKITLPTSAIPLWANQLSDEEWKSHVNFIIHGATKTDLQNG